MINPGGYFYEYSSLSLTSHRASKKANEAVYIVWAYPFGEMSVVLCWWVAVVIYRSTNRSFGPSLSSAVSSLRQVGVLP